MRILVHLLALFLLSACESDCDPIRASPVPASTDTVLLHTTSLFYTAGETVYMTVDNNADDTISYLALCGVSAHLDEGMGSSFLHQFDCSAILELPTTLPPGRAGLVKLDLPTEVFAVQDTTVSVHFQLETWVTGQRDPGLLLKSPSIEVLVP